MKEMRDYQAKLRQEADMMNKRMDNMRKEYENRMRRIRKDEDHDRKENFKERDNDRREEMEERRKEMDDRRKENNKRREDIMQELKEDKIIDKDAKNVSININNDEMIVNGVKQPDEVFKKYKAKFSTPPKKSLPSKSPKPVKV